MSSSMADSICQFFLEGNCKRGKRCRFSHAKPSSTSKPAPAKRIATPQPADPPAKKAHKEKKVHIPLSSDDSSSDEEDIPFNTSTAAPSSHAKTPVQQRAPAKRPASSSPSNSSSDSSSSDSDSDSDVDMDKPAVTQPKAAIAPPSALTASQPVEPAAPTPVANSPATQPKKEKAEAKQAKQPKEPKERKRTKAERKVSKSASPASNNSKTNSTAAHKLHSKTLLAGCDLLYWLSAKTRAHPRFESSYKTIATGPLQDGWFQTANYSGQVGGSRSGVPLIGMDCEMVETTTSHSEVARVTVVAPGLTEAGIFPGQPRVLLDLYIKPKSPVKDYRTFVSGVTKEHLDRGCTLRQAQEALGQLITQDTCIVGHSLNFDLECLKIRHAFVVDTAMLYTVKPMPKRTLGLRDLVMERFGVDCQPVGQAHDSALDALWPLAVVRQAVDDLESALPWSSESLNKAHEYFNIDFPKAFTTRLEVANIPKDMDLEQLKPVLASLSPLFTPDKFGSLSSKSFNRNGHQSVKIAFTNAEECVQAFLACPVTKMKAVNDGIFEKILAVPNEPKARPMRIRCLTVDPRVATQLAQETARVEAASAVPAIPQSSLVQTTEMAHSTQVVQTAPPVVSHPTTPAQPLVSGVATPQARPKFCSQCGAKLALTGKFCSQCGAPVFGQSGMAAARFGMA
eukprot:TRINITY_DN8703_c0_g1_i1.p1 TRINITY_DN8703_c0_g1~~TRINITY_DN8703_c0_g1_i1.p1  ORF type:complete len:681 (+),score=145.94 TRINITY_DN8703_c0_g1_i1:19-2061(+)